MTSPASAGYFVQITAPSGSGHVYTVPYRGHAWGPYSGFHARVIPWVVPVDVATAIVSNLSGLTGTARELTLALGNQGDPCVFNRVILLGVAPADNPQRRTLLLTDVRWYLESEVAVWDANVRRRIGEKYITGGSYASPTVADVIAYSPWSINAGSAYDWHTLADQGLAFLTTARHGRPHIDYVFDTFSVIDVSDQIVQEVTTDADGPTGLARIIEAIPGAGIYVDSTGKIHVFERTRGAEQPLCSNLPPPLMGHGDIQLQDNSMIRPVNSNTSWRIYVDLEVEVKCIYDPNWDGGTDPDSGYYGTEFDPYLIPVLQVTDLSLTIPAGLYFGGIFYAADTVVGQGTWIGIDCAFAAWGPITQPGSSITCPELTDDIVADSWLGDGLSVYYKIPGAGIDPIWASRIAELRRRWSTTFMVNQGFWDRVRHDWTYRAAVWDPSSGQHASSPVYQSYSFADIDAQADADEPFYAFNVTATYASPIETAQPTGFVLLEESSELGIFTITRDVIRLPGKAEIYPRPIQTLAQLTSATDIIEPALQGLQYTSEGWELAFIISCAPGSPNDLGRMYEIQVSADDAADAAGLSSDTPEGTAPDQEMRSQLAEARMPWLDATGATNLDMFGTDDSGGAITTDEAVAGWCTATDAPIAGYTSTLAPVNVTQELVPLAKAVAATDLLSKLDCYMGQQACQIDGATGIVDVLVPLGSIDRIDYMVRKGQFVAIVYCTPDSAPFHAEDFLKGRARSFLLKEVAAQR